MGFWQALGSFLSTVLNKAGEVNQEAITYKQQYQNLDTDQIRRKLKASSKLSERTACLSILEDRGAIHKQENN